MMLPQVSRASKNLPEYPKEQDRRVSASDVSGKKREVKRDRVFVFGPERLAGVRQ